MKNLFQYTFIFSVFIILLACNTSYEHQSHGVIKQHRQKGYYIAGHEVNSFQPCGQQKIFWVVGSEKILQLMQQKYNQHTKQAAYEKVFVELSGHFVGKASDGFAQDYDGKILVLKLFSMKKPTKNDCL